MVDSNLNDVEKQLAELQQIFKNDLPAKLTKIKKLFGDICGAEGSENSLQELYRQVHSLAGSGGTFGAMAISTAARELETQLKPLLNKTEKTIASSSTPLLDHDTQQQLNGLIIQLKLVSEDWHPSNIPYIPQHIYKELKSENLIYFVDDDALFSADLLAKLKRFHFNVVHFDNVNDFEAACDKNIPVIIIMDMVFSQCDTEGADVINRLRNKIEFFPYVIFLSVRVDIESRLAAARAGANRYFTKPIDFNKFSQTLNGLVLRDIKPYRILMIDDDETMLQYYATVLGEAGMEVKALSNPMQALEALAEFKPDVIVIDFYMPGCTGLELAQVVRQDDAWAQTPIMFLSIEADLNRQLSAMDLGGDDFLVKPVAADHLVSAVVARSKRSRQINRLNKDLLLALRESDYQTVTMNMHDIVSIADISGRITSVNEKFINISGYSRDELIGQNHRLIKSGYHSDSFYTELWKTISSGGVWHGVICNHNKNGNEYWVDSTIVPFLNDKGKPYKYVSARTDITDYKQTEERLERSQKFANIGNWDWNISSGELFWSERVWALFGLKKVQLKSTYDEFLAMVHPDDRSLVQEAVKDCIDKETVYDIEHRIVWPDGSVHWLRESGDVLRDTTGKATRMLGVVQDVTKSVQAREELIHAREEAENANRAKSIFLSSMSHELRTPMNAIMGFSQVLQFEGEQTLSVSQKDSIDEILKASEHLLQLINEVLDLSKIDAGRIDLSIENVLLGEVITESLQIISPLAEKRGVEIVIQDENNKITLEDLIARKVLIYADHTRIKQVILNLLSNAVKYNSENGKIILKYENINDNQICISITDTGQGLTEDEQNQLFTAFNRLGAESSNIEGTGIGLVITRNLVELMGGYIGFESTVAEGSTFWFVLPAGSDIPGETEYDSHPHTQFEEINKLKGGHSILYIEDNPANLRLVTRLLADFSNAHMWSAHEPLLGLKLAIEHQPDLILLDINLPGINGYELLQQLRAQDETRNIPVIAISANAMPQDIKKGLDAGFDDYITKPINIHSFLEKVRDKLYLMK